MNTARLVALGVAAIVMPTLALADFYSGDPYSAPTAWPQYTDNYSNTNAVYALTYDNFNWVPGAGGGVVGTVGGHFHSFNAGSGSLITNAVWEIRTGMSHNVGGTLVASGSGVVTTYATSFTQGGWAVWGVSVDVPDFTLPAGSYWFGLALGMAANPNGAGWFVASTTGTNGVGGPLGDDLSIYYQIASSTVNWNYAESAIVNPGLTGFDPSYFINEVPAPSGAAVLVGAGLLVRRRRA